MPLEIPIDRQAELFKKHIEEEDNDRIIFSGPFGMGKTYFLDKYFFGLEPTDYLAVKLAPINYSISSNEDIFKLIKYDILFELGAVHGLSFDTESVSRSVAYGTLLPTKMDSIVSSLVELLPLMNKPTDAIPLVLTALAKLSTTVKEIEKARNSTSESSDALDLGNEVAKSYQHETDYATEFIERNLERLAEQKKAKYKVLIIDDLDRIDPEHIFRLFNIFSAHLDYNKTQRNKFGFDKVIFVCDIQNIRNIFHTRYGTDTDFTGYIDKFFSQEVYFFSNELEIGSAVDDFVNNIRIEDQNFASYVKEKIVQGRNYSEKGLLPIILTELVLSGALKIRRFKNSYGLRISLSGKKIDVPGPYQKQIEVWQIPAVVTIEILSRIIGGGEALLKSIKTVIRYRRSSDYHAATERNNDWLIGNLLPIADYKSHKFKVHNPNIPSNYSYTTANGNFIQYELLESGNRREQYYARTIGEVSHFDFFEILSATVEVLLRDGLLK
ncbi:hypothetical protein JAO73_17270 [Hymenobacter sp. BT523]|uniref:P-loop NTPase fold protein n=1 Tax=Hymenobacter sp. BT523 TaxID=2795725 RepID=UPI0018ECC5A1|nr:P-loop NTPase fold protein [Hymenobacter sp. BT523]MBJ6110778.1 hypothetical protein [Hymenobacter sp. BT523]